MLKLYNFPTSGNCYKIRLLLTQLNVPFEKIDVDIVKGESRTDEFLKKNVNGKVPLLEIEPDQFLAESNAILFYLGENSNFLPNHTLGKIHVLRWMFFEQNSLEPSVGTIRYWITKVNKAQEYKQAIKQKQEQGYGALQVMESHLKDNIFFVENKYSIADICLFGYTHVADEAGFDLSRFTAIGAWMERVKGQPNYVSIAES